MSVTVSIPTILRPLTGDQKRVPADGATLAAVIDDLETRHAGIKDRLIADGALHRFVNVYVDDEDARFLEGLATPTPAGTSVSVIPAVAGG